MRRHNPYPWSFLSDGRDPASSPSLKGEAGRISDLQPRLTLRYSFSGAERAWEEGLQRRELAPCKEEAGRKDPGTKLTSTLRVDDQASDPSSIPTGGDRSDTQ